MQGELHRIVLHENGDGHPVPGALSAREMRSIEMPVC